MKSVSIMLLRDDGWESVGTITYDGESIHASTLLAEGILNDRIHYGGRDYSRTDGEEFLNALVKATANSSSMRILPSHGDEPQHFSRPPVRPRSVKRGNYDYLPGPVPPFFETLLR